MKKSIGIKVVYNGDLVKRFGSPNAQLHIFSRLFIQLDTKFDIFDNFCYVLFVVNEMVILSENSIPE